MTQHFDRGHVPCKNVAGVDAWMKYTCFQAPFNGGHQILSDVHSFQANAQVVESRARVRIFCKKKSTWLGVEPILFGHYIPMMILKN